MASVNRKKLCQWVARQVLLEHEDGPCRRMVVRHVISSKSTPTGEVLVEGRTDAEGIAESIASIIEDDAKELGDRQTYTVRAFFGRSSKEEVGGRDRFSAHVFTESDGDDALMSEGPNGRGVMIQQMRHNEALVRTMVQTVGQTLDHMARINATLAARLEKIEEGRMAQIETFEELLSKRHERELEATKLQNAERRKEQAFEKLTLLLPAVANKIVGKKVFPENIAGDLDQLKNLLASVTPEQLSKLGEILSPVQTTALLSIYEKFANDDKVETGAKNGAIVKSS